MSTNSNQILKVAQALTTGAKKIRLFPYPDMKAKFDTNLEEALEAKYIKEQTDSKKAAK